MAYFPGNASPNFSSKESTLPSSGCPLFSRLKSSRKWLSFGAVVVLTLYSFRAPVFRVLSDGLNNLPASLSVGTNTSELCPQVNPLVPSKNADVWDKVNEIYKTDKFKIKAADWLGGAVRIQCVKLSFYMPAEAR